jgi:hypothetical protein
MGFRALSFMPGLLGCRHRSPDGVQRNRVRFTASPSLKRAFATGARLWGWRPNNGRRGGGRRGAICSAELMPTWHFCLCPRVFWGHPAAGLRGKRDSYGLDIHLKYSDAYGAMPRWSPTQPLADEGSPFLGAQEGATSPTDWMKRGMSVNDCTFRPPHSERSAGRQSSRGLRHTAWRVMRLPRLSGPAPRPGRAPGRR